MIIAHATVPNRVVGASCVSGLAPYRAEGLDHFSGMGEANVDDFKFMMRDRAGWEKRSVQARTLAFLQAQASLLPLPPKVMR
jgi:hypothetical protein